MTSHPLSRRQRAKRAVSMAFWRVVNPPARRLAGIAPWWVLLETTGRATGRPRHTPLASGLAVPDGMWLNAVHGRHAHWVLNLAANPQVRLRVRRRWRTGVATIHPYDAGIVRQMNAYARAGPATMGLNPLLVHIRWNDGRAGPPAPDAVRAG